MSDDPIAITKFGFERERSLLRRKTRDETGDVHRRMIRHHIARLSEDVLQVGSLHETQTHIAIDSAKGEVIDQPAEWRNIGALGGIEFHRQEVVAVPLDMWRELEGERSISALVFAQTLAIDPHGRGRHCAIEIDENMPLASFWRQTEFAAVDGDELIRLLV